MTVPLWLHAAAWWAAVGVLGYAVVWVIRKVGREVWIAALIYWTVLALLAFVFGCPPAHSAERRTSTMKEVSHEGLHEGVASRECRNEGASPVRQETAGRKAVEGQSEERGWDRRTPSMSGVQGGPRSKADAAVLAGGVTLRWTAPTVQEGYSARGQRCLAGDVPERMALCLVVRQPVHGIALCVAKLPCVAGQAMAWPVPDSLRGAWFDVTAADSAGNKSCAGNAVWVP